MLPRWRSRAQKMSQSEDSSSKHKLENLPEQQIQNLLVALSLQYLVVYYVIFVLAVINVSTNRRFLLDQGSTDRLVHDRLVQVGPIYSNFPSFQSGMALTQDSYGPGPVHRIHKGTGFGPWIPKKSNFLPVQFTTLTHYTTVNIIINAVNNAMYLKPSIF